MNNMGFYDVRLFYSKTGRAKYISHLDVMRAFQRTLKRTGLNVWYTEGFHPHLYLTFALPLSLGYEGLCESVDFRIMGEEVPFETVTKLIDDSFPEGFKAISCARPIMDVSEISSSNYDISFTCDNEPDKVLLMWEKCFLHSEKLIVRKKTKRGDKDIDIKPLIDVLPLRNEDGLYKTSMKLSTGQTENINPSLVFDAFFGETGLTIQDLEVVRTEIYNANGKIFK